MTPKHSYIPENSTTVTDPRSNATVYTYTNRAGKPAAVFYYSDKTVNPNHHYSFRNEAQRTAYIQETLNNQADHEASRKAHAEAKKAQAAEFTNPLKPGDVLYESWGYDQTNVSFYQVIKTTQKTVTFRPIKAKTTESAGFMSGHMLPRPDEFCGPEETRPIRPNRKSFYVAHGRYPLYYHDGQPLYYSTYA